MRNSLVILLLATVGCGDPTGMPMVERLEPESQRVVDESWLNMLSPPERLDRSLLLDVLMADRCHARGVDRLTLTSEKDVWGGRVVMAIYYDRAHPAFDSFTITFTDAAGQERRRERYTFQEVKDRVTDLFSPVDEPTTQPATTPAEIEQQRKAEEQRAARLARQILITAATRPAGELIEETELRHATPPASEPAEEPEFIYP